MSLTCLEGLVGLAERDCPCVSGGQPSGYNSSTTGYYLDDWEHGFPIKDALYANVDCGDTTIWDTLDTARTQGIRDVKNDLLQALASTRESRVINWNGLIGKAEGIGSYITGTTYTGIQLRPRIRMRDAYFMLQAVWINIDTTKSVTVGVASNDGTFSATTDTASCTANTWTKHTFSTPVSLPLYSASQHDLRYHVYYQPDGAKSKQNRLWCCSKPAWMQHFEAGAFSLASLPGDDVLPTLQDAYGFAVEGYFTCNKLDWICAIEELNGVEMRDLVGRLIQWKSAMHLITSVLKSAGVNRWTMLSDEAMQAHYTFLQEQYANAVLWVAQNLPTGVTGCWGCDKHAPQVGALIS